MSQEIKSWNNGIVEDQAGSTLPDVHTEDNGKVLQVVEGQWQKGDKLPSPELPTPSADNSGKIAKVVSDGEGGYIWGAENETSQLPAPAVGDIGKIVGAVSDGEDGVKYGFIEKKTITFYYTHKDDVYGYYPHVKGKTATLQELYEYFVELGILGDQQSTLLDKYFDFEVDVQGDPNLPSDFTAVGAGASRFKLDLLSAYAIEGEYSSYEIKGTKLSSPENITSHAGIASVYMAVIYNQWAQSATVEVKTIPFATSAQN